MDIVYAADKVYALADTAALVASGNPAVNGSASISWTIVGIIALMLICGLLGGVGAYLIGPPKPRDVTLDERKWLLRSGLFLGIVAAGLVPVFLQLLGAAVGADKQVLDEMLKTGGNPVSWFIFAGFCLAAGVASKRFVSAVTDKLLKDLQKELKAVRTETNRVQLVQQELEEDVQDLREDAAALVNPKEVPDVNAVSTSAKRLLKTMKETRERRPSPVRLAEEGRVEPEQVPEALEELLREDLVRRRESLEDGSERLVLRPKAIEFLKKLEQ
jgi:uncharacterized protein YoxC